MGEGRLVRDFCGGGRERKVDGILRKGKRLGEEHDL